MKKLKLLLVNVFLIILPLLSSCSFRFGEGGAAVTWGDDLRKYILIGLGIILGIIIISILVRVSIIKAKTSSEKTETNKKIDSIKKENENLYKKFYDKNDKSYERSTDKNHIIIDEFSDDNDKLLK